MTTLFFELIQVAIGQRQHLSTTPTAPQWAELFTLSAKHTLVGIAYSGIERLPKEQRPELDIALQWNNEVRHIEAENRLQVKLCRNLVAHFNRDGFNALVFKGQANRPFYPEYLRERRTAGDIDVWVWPMGYSRHPHREVIEYCQRIVPGQHLCYIHYDFPVLSNAIVEMHIRPSFLCHPVRNHRLQKWFKQLQAKGIRRSEEMGDDYGALLLLHIYKHLFEEGIGLRQLLDYYLFLKHQGKGIGEKSLANEIAPKGLGLESFHTNLLEVLQVVFEGREPLAIKQTSRKLLDEIMRAGNFGQYDDRIEHTTEPRRHAWEKLKHNFRLIRLYPSEVLWEPAFRWYHWLWRTFRLWRWE